MYLGKCRFHDRIRMSVRILTFGMKRYLCFFHGAVCEVFNVGDYRRRMCGAQKPYQWFDSSNQEGSEAREVIAHCACVSVVSHACGLAAI